MVVNIYTIKALCDGVINLFKIFLMQFVRLSFLGFTSELLAHLLLIKGAYPVQRAPALCGVWGRVSVASLTLACAMRGDCDSNPGPSGHRL